MSRPPELLEPEAAAGRLGVTVGALHRMRLAGRIEAVELGYRHFGFEAREVERVAAERRREAGGT